MGTIPAARIAAGEHFAQHHVGAFEYQSSYGRTSSSPSGRIHGVAYFVRLLRGIQSLFNKLRTGLAVDELPGGNHRRELADAPLAGAYGAYKCATSGGG
jgi:hypothetical protein